MKNIESVWKNYFDMNIIVYLECCYEVVVVLDYVGLMKYIIDMIELVLFGSKWVIGIEMNLVNWII